ncbi:MAG TPA: efflux transporter outer membrane subunit [Limnobacter sp.]|nr:efflux transporter outer membrane subunit [Limnobacter sp.]
MSTPNNNDKPDMKQQTRAGGTRTTTQTGLGARLGSVFLAMALTACASIKDQRPQIDNKTSNASFKPLVAPGSAQPPAQWWTDFASPQLNTLIEKARADNLTLAATEARVRAARASVQAANAGFFPSLTLNAGRQENTVKGVSIQGQATNNRGLFTSASFVASYEIDLWSRVRSTAEAAQYQLRATEFELKAAEITIVADLASTWAQWVAAEQTVSLLGDELKGFKTNLDLVELRFRQGIAVASDVLQQRQLVESAQGNLAQAQANRDVLLTALGILVGEPPNRLGLNSEPLPTLGPLPSTGVPSAVLHRRPDVQQAWMQVLAVDRNVAAAIANRFPQVSLRASFSDQTRSSDFLFDNWVRNLSVNLVAPLFDGGARSAEADRQRALLDQAVAQYQAAALNALADVDNALVQESRQREVVDSTVRQLELAELSLQRLFAGYRNGTVDYIAILDAQQSTSQLRRNLLSARQQLLDFRISLYRAISGALPNT